MQINTKHLKYPLYLFLTILVAKIAYVSVESFYNYYVLVTTTNADLNEATLKELNKNGHIISAIGITLLIVPNFYFLFKKLSEKTLYFSMAVSSIIVYIFAYNLLNYTVDYIVESNKDKRHDAYYVNIFKYGVLNNIFVYNSFIPHEKIINNTLDINDRILLTNTFLLLHVDRNLIEKLKYRGKGVVADIYINKYKKEDFDTKYSQFKEAAQQTAKVWNEFNNARKKLKKYQNKLINKKEIKKAHNQLIASLRKKYNEYDKANKIYKKEIARQALNNTKNNLNRYFRYKNYARAQKQYRDTMNAKFGHYINPYRWTNKYGKVTTQKIKKVLKEELEKKTGGLELGLSPKEFINQVDIKVEVAKKLKENGVLIPYSFDYTYNAFEKAYTSAVIKKYNNAPLEFYKKLNVKIGKNDLKLSFTWDDFIYSNWLKQKIKSKITATNKKDLHNIIEALKTRDLANFKKMVYLPNVLKEVNQMMYSQNDFKDRGVAVQKGNEAIKLLYIPPFALAVSILALLLNLLTVLSMSLTLFNIKKSYAVAIKFIFIVLLVLLPVFIDYGKLENKFLESAKNETIKEYLNFLNWISFYEKINYTIHNGDK